MTLLLATAHAAPTFNFVGVIAKHADCASGVAAQNQEAQNHPWVCLAPSERTNGLRPRRQYEFTGHMSGREFVIERVERFYAE